MIPSYFFDFYKNIQCQDVCPNCCTISYSDVHSNIYSHLSKFISNFAGMEGSNWAIVGVDVGAPYLGPDYIDY